jgi:hypothetical protein
VLGEEEHVHNKKKNMCSTNEGTESDKKSKKKNAEQRKNIFKIHPLEKKQFCANTQQNQTLG